MVYFGNLGAMIGGCTPRMAFLMGFTKFWGYITSIEGCYVLDSRIEG